jgi:hypothetical protein
VLYHVKGADFTTSMYVTFSIIWGSNAIVGRPVPPTTTQMIPVTLSVGYAVSVVLQRYPWSRGFLMQSVTENWISACLLIAGAMIGGLVIRRHFVLVCERGKNSGTRPRGESFNVYDNGDVGYFKATYALIFGTSALAAICMIVLPYMQHGLVTGGAPAPLCKANVDTTAWMGLNVGKTGHCILILWLHTVVDLRRQGYTTTAKSLTVAAAALVCQLVLGPGAVYAAVWLWREALLASLSH